MLSSKSAKYWYNIKQKFTIKDTPLKESDDFLGLDFHDYFILNKVLHWTKPKEIGWVGGFTNLDFFISQKDVSGIKKCINFDGTPAGKWCSKRHKEYIKHTNLMVTMFLLIKITITQNLKQQILALH